jgi:hypothetical protein
MVKRWLGVALVAIGLGGTASAQNPNLPGPGQPTVMPEPIPFNTPLAGLPGGGAGPVAAGMPGGGAGPMAAGMPGPMTGPGTPEECSLEQRGDLPNAWTEDVPGPAPAVYTGFGWVGFTRQRPGHDQAAVFDFGNGGAHNGNTAPPGSREVLNFHDIQTRMDSGGDFLLGYHWDTSAIEARGFYVGQSDSAKSLPLIGALTAPFNVNGNFFSFPLGFEGVNGLWKQADLMILRLQTSLGSGEINYRWWLGADSNFSWMIGVRYLDLYERFSFYTGDEDITVKDVNGHPDPTREATYFATAHNRLVVPQLGLEWNKAVNCWLAFSLMAKGAIGPNFLQTDVLLKRGDGFIGFSGERNFTTTSELLELGLYTDLSLRENIRLRAGYNFLWALDIAEGTSQLDYNLANHFGTGNKRGSALYQGPAVELHILF